METYIDRQPKGFTGRYPTTGDDYMEVESDGTVVLNGDATVWEDIQDSLINKRLYSTTGKLDYNYDENSIKMQSGGSISNKSDRVHFNLQYPHSAKADGSLKLHIHWEQTSMTTKQFTVQYRIQQNGHDKATTWATVVVDSNTHNKYDYLMGTVNQITELASIDMSNKGLSAVVQFRLARTDTSSGDIYSTFIDAHFERDTFGSNEEYTK